MNRKKRVASVFLVLAALLFVFFNATVMPDEKSRISNPIATARGPMLTQEQKQEATQSKSNTEPEEGYPFVTLLGERIPVFCEEDIPRTGTEEKTDGFGILSIGLDPQAQLSPAPGNFAFSIFLEGGTLSDVEATLTNGGYLILPKSSLELQENGDVRVYFSRGYYVEGPLYYTEMTASGTGFYSIGRFADDVLIPSISTYFEEPEEIFPEEEMSEGGDAESASDEVSDDELTESEIIEEEVQVVEIPQLSPEEQARLMFPSKLCTLEDIEADFLEYEALLSNPEDFIGWVEVNPWAQPEATVYLEARALGYYSPQATPFDMGFSLSDLQPMEDGGLLLKREEKDPVTFYVYEEYYDGEGYGSPTYVLVTEGSIRDTAWLYPITGEYFLEEMGLIPLPIAAKEESAYLP